ncbi:MAG TPA: hypothetical protein VM555_03675 [Tahibacter sp.]|nr:hypothetical protein [Tahibacter sp.]
MQQSPARGAEQSAPFLFVLILAPETGRSPTVHSTGAIRKWLIGLACGSPEHVAFRNNGKMRFFHERLLNVAARMKAFAESSGLVRLSATDGNRAGRCAPLTIRRLALQHRIRL